MKKYSTKGICASEIHLEIKNNIIKEVVFIGGCSGNALGISSLVKGLSVEEVIVKLKGIDCRGRGTSCPDQLAKTIEREILEKKGATFLPHINII